MNSLQCCALRLHAHLLIRIFFLDLNLATDFNLPHHRAAHSTNTATPIAPPAITPPAIAPPDIAPPDIAPHDIMPLHDATFRRQRPPPINTSAIALGFTDQDNDSIMGPEYTRAEMLQDHWEHEARMATEAAAAVQQDDWEHELQVQQYWEDEAEYLTAGEDDHDMLPSHLWEQQAMYDDQVQAYWENEAAYHTDDSELEHPW